MQVIKKFILNFLIILILSTNLNAKENFLSLKKGKVNVRYGPGFDYDIKFIYKKKNLPLKIIDKKENFRRIIDIKKNSGWIHISQLKKTNEIILLENQTLFKKPSLFSEPIINIEKGRLLLIKKCKPDWCKIISDKYIGWIENNNVWGF